MSVVLICCVFAYCTYQRNKVWRTEETLWLDVTEKSPLNGRGLMNYGLTQMEKGELGRAKTYFERALPLTPNYAHLHINLGIINGALGDGAKAEWYFRRAIVLAPGLAEPYGYFARWLIDRGRAAEAEPLLVKALSISPADQFTRSQLLRAYAVLGDKEKLRTLAAESLRLNPNDSEAHRYINLF